MELMQLYHSFVNGKFSEADGSVRVTFIQPETLKRCKASYRVERDRPEVVVTVEGEGEMTAEASAERIRELETELKEARDTIAELKAKLYDCMTAAETIRDLKAKLYDLTAAETQE